MNSNASLFIIATLIVGAGAYWYFFTGTGNQPSLTVSTSENVAQIEFKTIINELPASFNTDILADARFNALADLTTGVSPESLGRLDPFAPVQGIIAK